MLMCPIIFSLVFGIYAINSHALKGIEMNAFFCLYIILASFSMSFFIPSIYEIDKIAGSYANDLRCGIDRKKIFFSKFLYIFVLLNIIEVIATSIMVGLLIFKGIYIFGLDLVIFYLISSIMLMAMIPMYQFLSLMFNYTGSILSGAFFTLTAILLGTTGLGEDIWYIFPIVWPVKIIYEYTKHNITVEYVMLFLILSLVVTLINILVFTFWYNKWDGYSKMEE